MHSLYKAVAHPSPIHTKIVAVAALPWKEWNAVPRSLSLLPLWRRIEYTVLYVWGLSILVYFYNGMQECWDTGLIDYYKSPTRELRNFYDGNPPSPESPIAKYRKEMTGTKWMLGKTIRWPDERWGREGRANIKKWSISFVVLWKYFSIFLVPLQLLRLFWACCWKP